MKLYEAALVAGTCVLIAALTTATFLFNVFAVAVLGLRPDDETLWR